MALWEGRKFPVRVKEEAQKLKHFRESINFSYRNNRLASFSKQNGYFHTSIIKLLISNRESETIGVAS